MIRLNKKGRPSKDSQTIMNAMNDLLDEMDSAHKYDFDKGYESEEELRSAYERMKQIKNSGAGSATSSSTNIEDAKIVSETNSYGSSSNDNFDSEPDGFNFDDLTDEDLDPNLGDTIERGYNKENIDLTATETIPEPIYSIESTPIAGEEPKSDKSSTSQQNYDYQHHEQPKPQQPKPEPANPALSEADEKTKKVAAEQLVDTILNAYDMLHNVAKPMAKIKEKKLVELEKKGLVDPNDSIIVDAKGTEATLREIIQESNQGIEDALTPDPTFHAKVRPPMVREFTKKGIGLTDGQQIAIAFGMDIGQKVFQIMSIRKNLSSIIDIFKESQKEKREYNDRQNQTTRSVNPDSISTPKQEVKSEPEGEVVESESVY